MKFGRAFWWNSFFAWLVFIGIDFLFHAGILKLFWMEDIPAIKPLEELARLIPLGYLSFFLLTLLIGYTFVKAFSKVPSRKQVLSFAVVWGFLFSAGNLAGLYSYVNIPLKQLVLFNGVYFIEIVIVCYVLNKLLYSMKPGKIRRNCLFIFFGLIILGIVLQNVLV